MENETKIKLLDIIEKMNNGWKDAAASELKQACLNDMVDISDVINRNNNYYIHRADDIWSEASAVCEKVKNFRY